MPRDIGTIAGYIIDFILHPRVNLYMYVRTPPNRAQILVVPFWRAGEMMMLFVGEEGNVHPPLESECPALEKWRWRGWWLRLDTLRETNKDFQPKTSWLNECRLILFAFRLLCDPAWEPSLAGASAPGQPRLLSQVKQVQGTHTQQEPQVAPKISYQVLHPVLCHLRVGERLRARIRQTNYAIWYLHLRQVGGV